MLVEHFSNHRKVSGAYPEKLQSLLNIKNVQAAFNEIKTWDGYAETPLYSLRKIASEVGVKNIYYKDESSRFGLGSFKALGGTYGVLKFIHHALESELGEEVSIEDIHRGNYDKSLKVCIENANKNDWHVISDNSYEGYTRYPRYIMAGYNVMAEEIIDQIKDRPPPPYSHIFTRRRRFIPWSNMWILLEKISWQQY